MARATRSASPSAVNLAHQADRLSLRGIDAAAGEKQIAHDRVAQIALEARNAAKAGNQAEPQFGKAKARHFVGDDQVARQRQLESAAECHAVNGGNGGERSGVDRVHHAMNSLEKIADAGETLARAASPATRDKVRADRRRRKSLPCARSK